MIIFKVFCLPAALNSELTLHFETLHEYALTVLPSQVLQSEIYYSFSNLIHKFLYKDTES